MSELQQRVSNLDVEAGEARDRARQLEARASSLDSEKKLLAASEERLSRMVEDLSSEKHKLRAQLQVEQKVRSSPHPSAFALSFSAACHNHRQEQSGVPST